MFDLEENSYEEPDTSPPPPRAWGDWRPYLGRRSGRHVLARPCRVCIALKFTDPGFIVAFEGEELDEDDNRLRYNRHVGQVDFAADYEPQ